MSVMQLSENHYQFIADSLGKICNIFQRQMPFHETRTKEFLADHADYKEREASIIAFVNRLYYWNCKAYCERYELPAEPDDKFPIVEAINLLDVFNPHQFLKALHCLKYQIDSAKDFESSLEGRALRVLIHEATDYIINELPAYQDSKWSL